MRPAVLRPAVLGRGRVLVVLAAALLGAGGLAACNPGKTTDLGTIVARDTVKSQNYYTNRDVGQSTRLSGVNAAGQTVTRDLWVFGDSDGWKASDGTHFTQFFPSNTASLVPLAAAGSSPAVPAMPAEFVRDGSGNPTRFAEFITGGTRPTCASGYYAARWPQGVSRLPDSDTRYETAVVFYQDFCVRLSPVDYQYKTGGVARLTWDARSPDAYPHASPMTTTANALFSPGSWHSYYSGADGLLGGTPGGGAYLANGPTGTQKYLSTLYCGPQSDCVPARVLVDPADLTGSLNRINSRTSWSYRAEGPTSADTDDVWQAFPSSGCTPTPYVTCTGVPKGKPVIKASSERLSQVWGAPSQALIGGYLFVTYTPGPTSGLITGDAAVRLADGATGVYGTANNGILPAGHCASGCYAPAIHPELNTGSKIAFSYVAQSDQTIPGGTKVSTLRLGWTCTTTFDTGQPC